MHRIRAGLVLSVGLAVASCGGDGSTEPEDSLTGEEASALLEVTMSPGLEVLASDEINEIVTPAGASLQFTGQCTMGGTVAVDARVTPSLGPAGGGVEVSATLVHSDCIERHTETGVTFTLNGAPEVETSIALSISESGLGISGTVAGTVRWATDDGRSGSCQMDVALEPANDPDALFGLSITLAGQACGTQINETFSAELPAFN